MKCEQDRDGDWDRDRDRERDRNRNRDKKGAAAICSLFKMKNSSNMKFQTLHTFGNQTRCSCCKCNKQNVLIIKIVKAKEMARYEYNDCNVATTSSDYSGT